MEMSPELFEGLFDSLNDAVYLVDSERHITYWNRAAEEISGYRAEEVVGTRCCDNVLCHLDDEGRPLCETACPLAETIAYGENRELEVHIRHSDGHILPVVVRTSPIRDGNGGIVGAAEVFGDNSAKVAAMMRALELEDLSYLDSLTGLGNRRHAMLHLRSRLHELGRYGWAFGVLFIGVDHLARVNDLHGRDLGDEVLRMAARTLENNLREFDFAGRWNDDEFICTVVNVDEEKLADVADRYRSLIEGCELIRNSERIRVTVSLGTTLATGEDDVRGLVARAGRLMSDAKAAGRNQVKVG